MYVLQKRIKICENCGMEYQPTGNCQKYCPDCKREMDLQRMRTRHYRTYVPKGYNQSGKNNNKFKATSNSRKNWVYSKYRKDACERCGATLEVVPRLVVHHKDGDATNNVLSNLITLCDSCHKLVHSGSVVL